MIRRLMIVMLTLPSTAMFGISADEALASGPHASQELVYVANANSGSVTAYPAGASGSVSSVRSLDNPNDPNTYWDPWGVTFDPSGNAYVQTFLSDATSFVFSPRSSLPIRMFQESAPDSESIAVDVQGFEYVMGGEGSPVISVAAPNASGSPSSLYSVTPIRQIQTGQSGFAPWASVLTVDNHDHVLAAIVRSLGNAIEVYQGGPGGPASPVRVISGPHTGLGSCTGFDTCDHVSITFSPHTGRIYAAVSGSTGAHICVFAGTAKGDARPVRTISGSRTGLMGEVVTGLADSQRTGEIYVLAKSAQFQRTGSVKVFSRFATGNVAPRRTFTDSISGLADGQGIAISR